MNKSILNVSQPFPPHKLYLFLQKDKQLFDGIFFLKYQKTSIRGGTEFKGGEAAGILSLSRGRPAQSVEA